MKKRRHHYVWRHYLKPWATNDLIWCKRDESIFNPNLMGIGQSRDFYKLRHLSENDIKLVKKLSIGRHSGVLDTSIKAWIEMITTVTSLNQAQNNAGPNDDELSTKLDILMHNLEEDYNSIIEGNAIEYLDSLYDGNADFYNDETKRLEFLYYLSMQYMRTKRIKENFSSGFQQFEEKLGVNIDNCWSVMRNINAMSLAHGIYLKGSFKILLLKNETSIPFITGDQPIFNTKCIDDFGIKTPSEAEFFYPISPISAILLTENSNLKNGESINLNEQTVNNYNESIVKVSHEQIYAKSKDHLDITPNQP